MGVSENSVPLNPMVLLIIIPMKNGFKSLGILTQHFQVQTHIDFTGSTGRHLVISISLQDTETGGDSRGAGAPQSSGRDCIAMDTTELLEMVGIGSVRFGDRYLYYLCTYIYIYIYITIIVCICIYVF